jgi:HK97 family phage major capsid protein
MRDYINRQVAERARAWGEAKSLLDHAAAENRDLTATEQETYDRINADLDERTAVIEKMTRDMEREVQASEVRIPEAVAPAGDDAAMIRSLLSGERRSVTFEKRQMTTANNDGTVPEGFYAVLQETMRYTGPFLQEQVGYTILNTNGGEDIKVPKQTAFSSATATAEAAAFAVSNPTTSFLTLRAHKFGTLVTVSSELIADAGIDIVGFIARQAGNALGNVINDKLANGTGTAEPRGIVTASAQGKVGGTAVGGAFTTDDLIDLVHSIDGGYANKPSGVGFQMRRATIGALRKLKDGEGRFIYDPTQGTQALLLGYPIFENPHIPAVNTSAKSVVFGDMSYYHVRQVGGIEVARSSDAFFTSDLEAFRVSLRVDGDLSQDGATGAVKHFVGGAS